MAKVRAKRTFTISQKAVDGVNEQLLKWESQPKQKLKQSYWFVAGMDEDGIITEFIPFPDSVQYRHHGGCSDVPTIPAIVMDRMVKSIYKTKKLTPAAILIVEHARSRYMRQRYDYKTGCNTLVTNYTKEFYYKYLLNIFPGQMDRVILYNPTKNGGWMCETRKTNPSINKVRIINGSRRVKGRYVWPNP